jgi:hypothetical protein
MRLIVHAGLHKTASTFLQHLLHDHRDALAGRGVLYPRDDEFRAQHRAGWQLLAGETTLLDAMLSEGRRHGCRAVIVSSEDLEAVLFNPGVARLIDAAAARAGADVEWHVALREPGAYFASLHAQLQWHVYADALWMFAEVMNKGGLYMHDPAPNWGGTPYWFYCFDHARHLGAFAGMSGHRPRVHDYADGDPFPGWRLLHDLGVLDLIERMPDGTGQNRRHRADDVRAGYTARIAEAGGASLAPHVEAAVAASLAAVPDCAALIGARFAASHAEALARYGNW